MHAQMVRLKNSWYIPDLPGFDEIRDNTVIVSVELDRHESMKRDYKELRGIAILERYQEKTAREDDIHKAIQYDHAYPSFEDAP